MKNGITAYCYRLRAQILTKIENFPQTLIGNLRVIDASCNASFMIDSLFSKYPSYTESRTCNTCHKTTSRDNVSLLLNTLSEEEILVRLNEQVNCRNCLKQQKMNVPVQREIQLMHHLLIEFVPLLSSTKETFR